MFDDDEMISTVISPYVTFYMVVNQVTKKPELLAHFSSFKNEREIKEFVKQFEGEGVIAGSPTIH
jgi:hypothetical protein